MICAGLFAVMIYLGLYLCKKEILTYYENLGDTNIFNSEGYFYLVKNLYSKEKLTKYIHIILNSNKK